MTDDEKEFHGLTRMEQLRIAEKHIAKLEAQLAAARDEAEKFARLCRGFKADLAIRDQQLAAERGESLAWRQRLTNSQEKVQRLEDALKHIAWKLTGGYEECVHEAEQVAKAALAKVGK